MDNENMKGNSLDAQHPEELEAARLRISQLEDAIKAKDKALSGLDERIAGLDRAWGISKIIITLVSSIMIPLFAVFIGISYNLRQSEISRDKVLAEVIPKFGSKDTAEKKAIAISIGIFEEHAITPLIAFLVDDDEQTRKAAAYALLMIGKKVIKPLEQFILNRFIPAKYKGEAILLMGSLSESKTEEVRKEVLENMRIGKVIYADEIDRRTHPFIARETVIALYSLDRDLSHTFLEKIDLSKVTLNDINLNGANLNGADFTESKLIKADFSSATLNGAVFVRADISDANFKDAKCEEKKPDWGLTIGVESATFGDTCVPR